MWPSLPVANHIADWANIFFIGSLVVGVASTVLIVWMANVKESHWDRARQESEERLVELGTRGDEARANIAKANAQIAAANVRVAKAEKQNLDLRAKIASRRITEEQHQILVDELSRSPGAFDMAAMGDPESSLFASDILKTLADAGWTIGTRELPLHEIWTGLVLFQTDDPAARQILDALLKAKIPFSIGDTAHKRDKATIMVGNKPSLF
jgi:hypothetical protein